ncbi:hypothetical protein [uncultured Roseibium sp.]|uniref:hypothetical protein n=1 Tax=uncultured Roseibium sp. TaxID=1936171 RepID=UPI002620F5FC|nr:hypothetical protein [uncultured Roseibium sp.]
MVERDTARRVIESLNARPELVSQRLRFKPLLWEDLPPGMAEEGDFQKRINTLIKTGGYGGYGVYVGMMKNRLGTPTPRYGSGTVEEFEESLKRRNRLGMPAEILFYFITDGSEPDPQVLKFKDETGKRGLLHATLATDEFAERLEQNLLDLAVSWYKWRAVFRRIWRPVRNTAAAVFLFALLSIGAFDLVARHNVNAALTADNLERANSIWNQRQPLMVFSGTSVQHKISKEIEGAIERSPNSLEALSILERWQTEAVLLPHSLTTMRAHIAKLINEEIDQSLLENKSTHAIVLWREAQRLKIWEHYPDRAENLVSDIAALRMIEALSGTGTAPETWQDKLMSPFQLERVHQIAKKIVSNDPSLADWPNRAIRTALAVMADRMDVLGTMSEFAAQNLDTSDQPEISAFVSLAGLDDLRAWLESTITPEIQSHIVYKIIEAVQAREQPSALLLMHDLASRGRFPDPGAALLSDVSLVGDNLERDVTAFLVERINDPQIHLASLELLLPNLEVARLSGSEREGLTDLLLRHSGQDLPPVVIDALSRLDTRGGYDAVNAELEEHLSGRTTFGFAHRKALMEHIRRYAPKDQRLAMARRLFEQTEADRNLIDMPQSQSIGFSLADGVESAYLEILALDATLATDDDRAAIARIVDRKALQVPTGPLAAVLGSAGMSTPLENPDLQPLGAALRGQPEDWIVSTLDFPPPPLIDPNWEVAWAKRQIVLAALAASPGLAMDVVSNNVLRSLPENEALKAQLIYWAANIGPETTRSFARRKLDEGDRSAIEVLVRLRDTDRLLAYLDEVASGQVTAENLDYLSESALELPATERQKLLAGVVEKVPAEAGRFLDLAAEETYRDDLFEQAAETLMQNPASGRAAEGLRYFAGVSPERAWQLVAKQSFVEWLGRADPFTWVGIAQELPPLNPKVSVDEVRDLVVSRTVLTGFDYADHQGEDRQIGQMAINANTSVVSHLLAASAVSENPEFAVEVLSQVRLDGLSILGNVSTPLATARAYLSWLAAGPVKSVSLECLPSTWLAMEQLDDTDTLTARAAASLLLARPSLAVLPTCP